MSLMQTFYQTYDFKRESHSVITRSLPRGSICRRLGRRNARITAQTLVVDAGMSTNYFDNDIVTRVAVGQ